MIQLTSTIFFKIETRHVKMLFFFGLKEVEAMLNSNGIWPSV